MKRVLKWVAIVLGGILGLIVVLGIVVYMVSNSRFNRTYEVSAEFDLDVPTDPERIAAGEKVATLYLCTECHGENLAGQPFMDDPTFGQIYTPNLTPGETGIGDYSDEALAKVIWYGVKPDGSPTVGMPPEFHQGIHVSDMENLIAYLRSVPPVDTDPTVTTYGPILHVMHVANMFPLIPAERVDASKPPLRSVSTDDPLVYGEHLAIICAHCHMADFAGDTEMMGSPNITPAVIGTWTEAEFVQAITEGVLPDGTLLDPKEMPWPSFSAYTDEDLHALWTYLQTVEPVPVEE